MSGPPVVIAHRGASALAPEHTLAAYARALDDGADWLEPDLVATADGVLVVRHEPTLGDTTTIARYPELAARRRSRVLDGRPTDDWFALDLTLAEFSRLRAVERLPGLRPANTALDGRLPLLTWDALVEFAAAESAARGRTIGLVPELKHSTFHRDAGVPLEEPFLASLARVRAHRLPLIVQSFETANLKALREALGRPADIRLMQLVDPAAPPFDTLAAGRPLAPADLCAPAGLARVATYADILAPAKAMLVPVAEDGRLAAPTRLVADAHAAGLLVAAWTFRPENAFLPPALRGGPDAARNEAGARAELRAFAEAGVDMMFADDPGLARAALG